jgi:hypothetical membrane protein
MGIGYAKGVAWSSRAWVSFARGVGENGSGGAAGEMTLVRFFKITRWAVMWAAVLIAAAMLRYPGGTWRNRSTPGYSFFENSLSDLGATVAWSGKPNTGSPLLFAAGFGLAALAGAGCLVALVQLYSASPASRWLSRGAGAFGVVSSAGVIAAAFTPWDRHQALHHQFVFLAAGAFTLASTSLAWAAALNERFPRKVCFGWLILAGSFVAWLAAAGHAPRSDQDIILSTSLQKLVVGAMLAMVGLQSREAERVASTQSGRVQSKRLPLP